MAAPTWKALNGDCLVLMQEAIDKHVTVDSIVTDPPYHLQSINKRFAAKGFMGKKWDGGDIAFDPATWKLAFNLLKPGGHLIAFGGSRTYHRMACAIEDAGFEIRDQLMWLYGTGFPKSHDVSKGIDKAAGAERTEVIGVRPGHEDFVDRTDAHSAGTRTEGWDRPWKADPEKVKAHHMMTAPATEEAAQWEGWGTALKPAHEPIVLARKPLEGTVAQNVLKHGVGALNINATRVGDGEARKTMTGGMGRKANPVYGEFENKDTENFETTQGRWPANVVHDGSDEVEEEFAKYGNKGGGYGKRGGDPAGKGIYHGSFPRGQMQSVGFGDSGTASRFFYCAKAGKADRAGSKHPTVKPVALMRWLVRMVTPPGGTVLDPFAGSGTTGEAAVLEGMKVVLLEADETYYADLVKRMEGVNPGSQEKPIRKRSRT